MNLYDRIEQLCKQSGVNMTEMCKDSGVTRSKLTDLKMGRIKSLSTGALSKIADYFDVSIDYLLGKEERNIYITGNYGTGKSTIITQSFDELLQEKTKKSPSVSDEDIKFALFGGEGEITDEMWEAVREYAQFVKEKYGKK